MELPISEARPTPPLDPLWTHNYLTPERRIYGGWRHMEADDLRRESYFTCDKAEADVLAQAYRDCLHVISRCRPSSDLEVLLRAGVAAARGGRGRLPRELRAEAREVFEDLGLTGPREWWEQAFGDL
ncbi:hypothetical protein SMC26_02850 [Actinomadura fulvescens]|uniref:Uncharacterized protein n=1 Tax=Actinomadura fulvescens TaxID=46160 RepID=A0ABN3PW25_9ACTN